MPYLKKAKILLDHLEKVVLLGTLGVLGYFALTKMLGRNSMAREVAKDAPTSRGEIRIGGDMVPLEDVSSFHESLNTATNTNKTPRLELLKGLSNHFLFSPEVWMTNQSLGLFRADDGERKRGIEAMSVVGPPYSLFMKIWAEVRVNNNGNVVNYYVTIRDEYLRYQTTNQGLFNSPQLHPFMPTTNAVLIATNKAGQVSLLRSLLPFRADNEFYNNWVSLADISAAGFVDKLHTNSFQRTWDVFPDRFEKKILKHPNPAALVAFEEAMIRRRVPDPTLLDPNSHPERLVLHFQEHITSPGTVGHFFKMKLYMHPATNVVHFGGGRHQPLPAYVLQPNQPEGSSAFLRPGFSIRRGEFINLEYGHGTNHRILFPACRPGRKLFVDGTVYIIESITPTHVVLGKDPDFTPSDDPSLNRKVSLPIPNLNLRGE